MLVGEVVVAALPTAVVGEAQSAREEERVRAGLATPREPLPLGRDREVRPRVEAGRGEVRGRGDLVARLAAVELGEEKRLTIESFKKVMALSVICMTFSVRGDCTERTFLERSTLGKNKTNEIFQRSIQSYKYVLSVALIYVHYARKFDRISRRVLSERHYGQRMYV